MGGMAAVIPNRREPEVTAAAFEKVHADKAREAGDGFDGSWVAHPDLVPVCEEEFTAVLGEKPNQLERQRPEVAVTSQMLLDVESAPGAVTEAGVHAAMRDRLGLTPDRVEAVLADMWEQYLGTPNTELIEYARALRPAYRTGILSNSFVGAREREQRAYGLTDLVDDCLYSHEVGMSKPDPALWALTCRRMGVPAAEIVFVDDVPRMVESARAYGMKAVLFESTAQVIAEVSAHQAATTDPE
jgi:putative hydrolase of the HAD superfamily